MSIAIYKENDDLVIGVTLKDERRKDSFNMAFHDSQSREHVLFNRQLVADYLQVKLTDFVCARQTHSNHLYKVTHEDRGRGALEKEGAIENVDALYTYEKNLVLTTFAADCVPLMFYNAKKQLIGVIHSGWRGSVSEITNVVFNSLIEKEGCHIEDFHVYLGPAISERKFEVDEDVYKQYLALGYVDDLMYYKAETKKYHINNKAIIKRQCERLGIPAGQIMVDSMCSYESEKGFSHRQTKTPHRHMGFIIQY